MLANFDDDRQWFNTLIPPLHKSAAVTVDCISCLSGPVRLVLRYTMADLHYIGGMSERAEQNIIIRHYPLTG